MRKLIYIGFTLLFISLAGIVAFYLYPIFWQPMRLAVSEADIIQVTPSMPATSFVRQLKVKQLIPSERLLLFVMRMKRLTSQLKVGIYQVHADESPWQFLQRVIAGDVLRKTFRIIPGTTWLQVANNLKSAPYLNYSNDDWSNIPSQYPNPEGLLLAETYSYDAGSKSSDLLKRAKNNLLQYLEASWNKRDFGLPYQSAYELLIAASILEKETALSRERLLISGVIVNRLRKKMPLQVDPSVIYALGAQYKGKLVHEDLLTDSPYNTYRHRGLPPTPIAMVGKDAIEAAAHPAVTDYLYFVAKGDGSHYFSTTYEEQKKSINRVRYGQ